MSENSGLDSFKERKFFADRLAVIPSVALLLLVSIPIGTIAWAMIINPDMMESWIEYFVSWLLFTIIFVAIPIIGVLYPLFEMIDSYVCVLVNSISKFKNIPSFTESPKLNVLLLVYGFKIRKFVSGGAITDLVIDDRIKHAHKKVEDILSEPAVVDVIKNGQSRHFKKDVVASVTEVVKGAIREVDEISKNAKIENNNKTIKQNEESDHRVVEFLAREK